VGNLVCPVKKRVQVVGPEEEGAKNDIWAQGEEVTETG